MRVFLVDTENVGWWALDGASKLNPEDMIYVLVGKGNSNSENVKSPIIIEALRSKAKYIIEETGHIGKNYLDFQLSLMIGEIIAKYQDAEVVILSKDQGYKAVLDYLNKHNRKGHQATSIREYLNPAKQQIAQLENNVIDVEVKKVKQPKKKTKNQKMVINTDEDLKKYQDELVNIIQGVFPNKKKATVILQASAASKKKTKKELKKYCQSNLKDDKLVAYCKMCQIFPY